MKIFYGKGAYRRDHGSLPELKLVNMQVEQSPANEDGIVLQSRKGLQASATIGTDQIRGVFRQAGVFDGDTFTVCGSNLYRESSLVGTVSGSGPVSFAASALELAICAGGDLCRYDGSLSTVTFPDGKLIRKVLYHDGLFLAIPYGDDKFYASDVLDASNWDALSFKAAESSPDYLLDAEVLSDMLHFFGSNTIELWANDDSGDTVPYSRQDLATIEKGIRDTGCVVKMDQGLWIITNENIVEVIRGGEVNRVSDHGIEERLAASSTASCFGYVYEGHSFFCVRLDDATYCLDVATNEWFEGQTLGLDNLIVQCATVPGDDPIFGGSDGKLYGFGGWTDGAYPLVRLFTAGIPLTGGAVQIDVISLNTNPGHAAISLNPVVEMRVSRDGGQEWGAWRSASLGTQGNYRTRVRWRRLGMFDEPGALIEFRTADAVDFRVGGVFINEKGGGRSR